MPHGLRELLGDLYTAGAAVDFSVLYPSGALIDAPLPTWTHRSSSTNLTARTSARRASTPSRCIRCWARMCGCCEEPERHAWEAEVGTEALPWLGDHKIHDIGGPSGRRLLEMALTAARTVLGETGEVRDVRFERCCCSTRRPPVGGHRHRPVARCRHVRGGSRTGRRTCAAGQRGPACRRPRKTSPPAHDIAALLAAASASRRRRRAPPGVRQARSAVRSGLRRPDGRADRRRRCRHGARRGRPAPFDPVATDAPTACIRPCWTPASSRWRPTPRSRAGHRRADVAVGRSPAADATATARDVRYCLLAVISADASWVEADLDILDEQRRGAARGRRSADRQRRLRKRQPAAAAGRAAADHRMAAARAARQDRDRPRHLAADQHLRGRGHGGHLADRRPQSRTCAQPRRCPGRRKPTTASNAERAREHLRGSAIQRRGRAHRTEERQPGRRVPRRGAATTSSIWCASSAGCPKSAARHRGCSC